MRVTLDRAAIDRLLHSDSGPVVRRVASLGRQVENRAKQKVGVDTGRLRGSISHVVNTEPGRVVARVGSSVQYARYHHDGTGVYGPKGRPIRPKTASHLVFRPKGSNVLVFASQVQGSRPNPYLVDALTEVVPWPVTVRT